MSFLSFLPIIGEIIDRIIPDKNAAAKAKAQLEVLEQTGELQLMLEQIKVNRQEAKHKDVFVAGWRPSIGWACSLIFIYHYLLYPIIITIAAINGIDTSNLPIFDLSAMMPILGGLLGLGALRSFEKWKGVNDKHN
jgi:hypothetical protein